MVLKPASQAAAAGALELRGKHARADTAPRATSAAFQADGLLHAGGDGLAENEESVEEKD